MPDLYARLRRAIQKRGWKGTLQLLWWKICYACGYWTVPTRYRERRLDREFDFRFGVDTSGILDLEQLGVQSQNVAHATWYEQTKPAAFDELMKHLNIRYEDFIFVDFGSGKGRAVFLASEYPFRKIIGVEFAPRLHEIAEQNLVYYYSPTQKCEAIELHCQDATEFVIPPEPAVYYFYNPFDEAVMTKVLENITHSLRIAPRPVFILYCNSRLRELVQQFGFTEIASSFWYSVLCNNVSWLEGKQKTVALTTDSTGKELDRMNKISARFTKKSSLILLPILSTLSKLPLYSEIQFLCMN